ncbi:hypothetical protein DFQ28_006460 [Apophysomyces sp. BC1034]|nr:hypothetical protein DFQ30_004313 [Apophysomyces sp. BC1015]KAG0182477.1 hypothetical protein DFQ29_003906 [Apophysomyces sp. BC1021]KAG0193085.1 hypothetical protein DFQ28_006460 [Apophysomyces sp. BC1034]
MSVKLFVGGLAWATTDDALYEAFSQYGQVVSAAVIKDRETGRSRGFGFVTYESQEEAEKAIEGLHNSELDGRTIKVDRAAERQDRPRQSFRPRNDYGGGNGGSRYGGGRDYNNDNQGGYGGGYDGGYSGGNDYQQSGGY